MYLYQLFISYFNGYIEGLFITKAEDVASIIGKSIYFTEEELTIVINQQHITKLEVKDSTIEDLLKHFSDGTIAGYNIVHMISNQLNDY